MDDCGAAVGDVFASESVHSDKSCNGGQHLHGQLARAGNEWCYRGSVTVPSKNTTARPARGQGCITVERTPLPPLLARGLLSPTFLARFHRIAQL